jgi:hypothetical protein
VPRFYILKKNIVKDIIVNFKNEMDYELDVEKFHYGIDPKNIFVIL